uniref:VWFA domain-containing protein n=1 Tax=Rhabditophanes sp. KR3021 TaxID=114890 RepID=A0AC35TFW1_9BILA
MQLLRSLFVLSLGSLTLALPISNIDNNNAAYYPCPADILMVIDSSSDALTTLQFNAQIQLVKNVLVTSDWTDFERVGLAWYNSIPTTHYGFGTMQSKREFDLYVSNAKLDNGTDFTDMLNALLQMQRNVGDSFSLNTFIFVSTITTDDIARSVPVAKQLKALGSLNLIILGSALNVLDVAPIGANAVISWDFTTIDADLNKFVLDNTKCSSAPNEPATTTAASTTFPTTTLLPSTALPTTTLLPSTTTLLPSTTTQSPTTTTTTTLRPTTTTGTTLAPTTTIPQINTHCKALVSFSVDASSDILDEELFNRQISFIQNPLTKDYKGAPWHKTWHNIAIISYAGRVIDVANFGQFSSSPADDGFLDQIQQEDGMSLKDLLPTLIELELDSELKLNTVIFISETLKSDIRECHEGAAELLKRGSLIFIAMGNTGDADVDLLKTLPHTAVIAWPDMLVYDHKLLRQQILGNFACSDE